MKRMNKILILGLGNEYITDDGVGIHTIRELQSQLSQDCYTFMELAVGGLELLDYLSGYDKAVIVDAFVTGSNSSGTIYRLIQTLSTTPLKIRSSHQIDLPQVMGLAKELGIEFPKEIIIYGIEAEDITTFKCCCTDVVAAAIPRLVRHIQYDLEEDIRNSYIQGLEIIN
jgi:hydrogenase maturation protease